MGFKIKKKITSASSRKLIIISIEDNREIEKTIITFPYIYLIGSITKFEFENIFEPRAAEAECMIFKNKSKRI